MAFNRIDLTVQKLVRAMENGDEQEAEFYKDELTGGHEPTKDARGASELKRWLGQLTDADKKALEEMPDEGWFDADDVILIKRHNYRCERLTEKGVLETRVIKEPYIHRQWRKKKLA